METLRKFESGWKAPKVDKSLGESNKNFISTDLSIQYLARVIDEKNKGGHQLYLTGGLIVKDISKRSADEAVNELVSKYEEILIEHPNTDGIYTVVNMAEKALGPAHQNWILFQPPTKRIILYEPNGAKGVHHYNVGDVLERVAHHFRYKFVLSIQDPINYFDGCRATSTLLALFTLLDIDMKKLEKLSNDAYLPLTYALSQEIKECDLEPLKRRPRNQRGLETIIKPSSSIRTTPPKSTGKDEVIIDLTLQNMPDISKMTKDELKFYLDINNVKYSANSQMKTLVTKALKIQSPIHWIDDPMVMD